MAKFDFTLIMAGADMLTDEHIDALFEAGCDDATFGEVDGVQFGDFSREAPSLASAVGPAIRAVESAMEGLRVVRVEPDDIVSASDIAARLGRSRESVRLLIEGRRGPGGFPPPAAGLRSRRRMWRWSNVVEWGAQNLELDETQINDAMFVAALNSALELRALAPGLTDAEQRNEVAGLLAEDHRLYA